MGVAGLPAEELDELARAGAAERPPIVFEGEIRHWVRILFAFTRPYFGTARIMSKAFAEST